MHWRIQGGAKGGHGPPQRDQTTCFDPIKTLLVYKNNTRPKNMTFSQSFQSHIWKVAKEDIGKSLTNDSYFKRVHCTVDELDTAYDTMDMKPKCAIIGNSGILLNSRCGREIDSHDYVIRANLPGLKEYNRDVGNKTTLMMMNRAAVGSMCKTLLGKQSTTQAKENYRKMLEYFRYMNDSILWMAKGTGSFRKHLQRIAVLFGKENIHTRFGFSYVSTVGLTRTRWRTRKVPSSGLIMLAIAETFCQNMTLYGFYPYAKDPSGNPVLYHYYQPNLTDFHTNAHDFDKEHKMLRSLQDQGFLRLVIDPCGK
ncbi:alpha-2,8-sialyltransferase 8B-like isoform X2 [Apostichopus japonicus]|uniref:alpha-2,8-sialyltransferase 8B-like isoform X2 n=1 Tax=Stichopus japonicus TaxID=307972 RepID=UPI003AB64B43